MQVPPALAEAAIIGPTSELIRRVEIYESDGTTHWVAGANDDRLIGGQVNIDYTRDERRSFDLELDNSDFALVHAPTGFWYDKVLKVFCGVRYTSIVGTTSQQVRTNYWTNPRFEALGSTYAARKNLHPNPLMVDGDANGLADGAVSYLVNGSTHTPSCSGGTQTFSSVTLPAGATSRAGFYWNITVTSSATQKRTISVNYTLAGAATNKRVRLWIDALDAGSTVVGGSSGFVSGIADAGRLAFTSPANSSVVTLRVYCWADTTDAAAASGITVGFSQPLVEEAGIELPYFDINWKARERYNYHMNSLCTYGGTQHWYSNNGALYVASINTTRGTPFGQNCMTWTRQASTPNTVVTSIYSHNGVDLRAWKCNPGDSVTQSIWISTDVANRRGRCYIQWVDAANNTLATEQLSNAYFGITVGAWTRVTCTDVAPANAQAWYPVVGVDSSDGSTIPTGETCYTTAWQLEKSPYLRDFFHPAINPPTGFTAAWAGTVNQSGVYMYQTDPTYAWSGTANASPTELRFTPAASMTGVSAPAFAKSLRATSGNGSISPYSSRFWVYGDALTSSQLLGYQTASMPAAVPGDIWSMRLRARVVMSNDRDVTISARLGAYNGGTYIDTVTGSAGTVLPKSGAWVDIPKPNTIVAPATTTQMRWLFYAGTGGVLEGESVEIEALLIEKVATPGGYFDGSIPDFGNRDFAWVSTVNASNSTETRTIIDQTPIDTTWEVQVGEFLIDNISESNFPYTVKVTGRDYTKKCLVSKFTQATSFADGTAIESVIQTIASNAGISKFLLPLTGKALGKDYYFERGMTRWEAMKSIADGFGFELFFDAQGYLVMREYLDPVTAPLAYTLETGTFGNLVTYEKSLNDTRIYNHIVVTGESQDSESILVSAEAINTEPSSPTRIAKLGDRVYQFTSSFITTTPQAQDVADKFLQLHALEEFDLNFSSIALPWLEVGEIVEFEDPRPAPGQPTRFLLSQLNLPLSLGTMSGNAKRVSVVG